MFDRTFFKNISVIVSAFLLNSCLAVGVPYTNDPERLIKYGNTLIPMSRVWRAEEMYLRALDKYSEEDNKLGMAIAHIKLGELYRMTISTDVSKLDCSAVKEKRGTLYNCPDVPRAKDEYRKAIELLNSVEASLDKYEQLRVSYSAMAAMNEKSDTLEACEYHSEGLKAYREGQLLDPEYIITDRHELKYDEFVASAKQQLGCR